MAAKTDMPPPPYREIPTDQELAQRVSLVLGAMQMGKSTWLNYMTNPQDARKGRAKMGKGQDPCTVIPEQYTAQLHQPDVAPLHPAARNIAVNLLDTPGLEDVKDNENIVEIYKSLKGRRAFSVPVLVHMFRRPFTQGYTNALQTYKKMMPEMFDQGLIVVITNYKHTEEFREELQYEGINEQAWADEFNTKLISILGLRVEPHLIFMNCLPINQSDKEKSRSYREFIFQKISTSPTISFAVVRCIKPAAWAEKDKTRIIELHGVLEGYRKRIVTQDHALEKAVNEQKRLLVEREKLTELRTHCEKFIAGKNTNSPVLIASWSSSQGWTFGWRSDEWDLQTEHRITKRVRTTSNECDIMVKIESEKRDQGKFTNGFARGTYGQVNLFTEFKYYYADEIRHFQAQLGTTDIRLDQTTHWLADFEATEEGKRQEIADVKREADALQKDIDLLSQETMTVDELIARAEREKGATKRG